MAKKLLPALTMAFALSPCLAQDTPPVEPSPEQLANGVVIDCSQFPPEVKSDWLPGINEQCAKNARLIGYAQGWNIPVEEVPQSALENTKSRRCKAVADGNLGYMCVGVK